MKQLIIPLLLFQAFCLNAQVYYPFVNPFPFPKYEEVLGKFYQEYQGISEPLVRISKHQDGFRVKLVDVYGNSLTGPQQIWTTDGGWIPVRQMQMMPTDVPEEPYDPGEWATYVQRHLQYYGYDRDECDRQPFYGYPGYYNDVIRVLEPEYEQLNTQQLHSLARSYSFAASGLLGNNAGYADSTKMFRLPPGQKALSEKQLEQYKSAISKSILAYELLQKRDPDFETPVGPARTKYANEILDIYLILLYFHDEQAARTVLKPGLYDEYLLQAARNMLASCPQDAILVTYGDSDTYLPLYVQAMENYRTDVLVANMSLLNVPRYCSYIQMGSPSAKPLQTNLPEAYFRELYILQDDGSDRRGKTQTASEFFKNIPGATVIYAGPGYQLLEMKIPPVVFPPAPEAASLPGMALETVLWEPPDGYVYLDALMLLDAATSNAWQRPLCFSTTCLPDVYEPFQGNLALEGLVYRLYPNAFSEINPYRSDCPVSESASLDLWRYAFKWLTIDKPLTSDKIPFYTSHRIAGMNTVFQLKKNGRCAEAVELVKIIDQYFTDAMQSRDHTWIAFVEVYAECGFEEEAGNLGLQIWGNYKAEKLPYETSERTNEVGEKLRQIGEKFEVEALKSLP